jgi:hypothetical protein
MTKEEKIVAELLAGKILESVGFENDCVQLNFTNITGVNIITKPVIEIGGITINADQRTFQSAVGSLINQSIENIQIDNEKYFIFKFLGGGTIKISLNPEDRQGVSAEAVTVHAQPHKIWVF